MKKSPVDPPPAIGADLGGTNLKIAALRGNQVLARLLRPVAAARPRDLPAAIHDGLRAGLAPLGLLRPGAGIKPAMGCAVPGFLDPRRRRILHLSHLPALDGFPLARYLERRFKDEIAGPVLLDADSNAGAFAEAVLGAARRIGRALYVTLGTGLGAAMVIDAEVVRVSNHTLGQVAHLPLSAEGGGPRCACGAAGCAEALLAAGGLRWQAERAGLSITEPADLWRQARAGPRRARTRALRVFSEMGKLLGQLLAMLANLFSPECIVIGGGIAQSARFFLPAAAAELEKRAQPRLRGKVRLRRGRLGTFSGAIGAALLSANHLGLLSSRPRILSSSAFWSAAKD